MKRRIPIIQMFLLGILFSLLLCTGSFADKTPFDLDQPLQEGIQATQAEEYENAVESFRKVLFIDVGNARAQYGLAYALEKIGKKRQAFHEYKLFIKFAQHDTVMPRAEKERYIAEANKAIKMLCSGKGSLAYLTFIEINIIIISVILTIIFLVKLLRFIFRIFPDKSGEDKQLSSLWQDKAALKNDEREVRIVPFDFFNVVMFAALIFFYWLVYSMIICK